MHWWQVFVLLSVSSLQVGGFQGAHYLLSNGHWKCAKVLKSLKLEQMLKFYFSWIKSKFFQMWNLENFFKRFLFQCSVARSTSSVYVLPKVSGVLVASIQGSGSGRSEEFRPERWIEICWSSSREQHALLRCSPPWAYVYLYGDLYGSTWGVLLNMNGRKKDLDSGVRLLKWAKSGVKCCAVGETVQLTPKCWTRISLRDFWGWKGELFWGFPFGLWQLIRWCIRSARNVTFSKWRNRLIWRLQKAFWKFREFTDFDI